VSGSALDAYLGPAPDYAGKTRALLADTAAKVRARNSRRGIGAVQVTKKPGKPFLSASERREQDRLNAEMNDELRPRTPRERVQGAAGAVGGAVAALPRPNDVISGQPLNNRWVTAIFAGIAMLVVASQLSGNYFTFGLGNGSWPKPSTGAKAAAPSSSAPATAPALGPFASPSDAVNAVQNAALGAGLGSVAAQAAADLIAAQNAHRNAAAAAGGK